MDSRDFKILVQNANNAAAALVQSGDVDEFESIRLRILNGTLELLGTDLDSLQAKAAEAAVTEAFSQPPTSSSGGRRIVVDKQIDEPLPDWLPDAVDKLIAEGKLPDAPTVYLWENRNFLAKNPRTPHFKTKYKAPGEQYGIGIWPPKAA